MKLHLSLRPATSAVLLTLWVLLALGSLIVSWGGAFVFLVPAAVLGVFGGLMQRRALLDHSDAFRRAQTALEVRRAFRNHRWGALFALVPLYAGFALGRDATTLSALDSLD